MKLTLRTLLAYVNHLLPPKDTEEFEQLLNENKLASTFCQRVESVMTRPELGAPEILDTGQYLDPNIAAEYLDNTLSAEVSPEYEKLCLSSDRLLAEVSACHHILAVVQTTPAEVENTCRERVYALPKVIQGRTANLVFDSGLGLSNRSNASQMSGLSSDKSVPPIPDISQTAQTSSVVNYSQNPQATLENYAQMLPQQTETQSRQPIFKLRWILVGVIAIMVIVVAIMMFMAHSKDSKSDKNHVAQVSATQTVETSVPSAEKTLETPKQQEQSTAISEASEELQNSKSGFTPVVEQEAKPNNVVPEQPEDTMKMPVSEVSGDNSQTTEFTAPNAPNVDATDVTKPTPEDVPDDVPEKEEASIDEPSDVTIDTNPETADKETNEVKKNEENALTEVASKVNEAPEQIFLPLGQYLIRKNDEAQILLRKHLNQVGPGIWNKVSEQTSILAGDTLIVLPDYCSELIFGNQVRVRLIGPARVFIAPESTSKEIHLKLVSGLMTVSTLKSFAGKVVVQSSNMPTVIEQTQPSTKIAFQALPMNIFNADPAVESVPYTGTIIVLVGATDVQYDGNTNTVDAISSIDAKTGIVDSQSDIPDWVTNKVEPLPEFNRLLTSDKSDKHIGVLLSEIGGQKGISGAVRQKALLSLAMIGKYTDLIEDFNKEDKFSLWQGDFDVLQTVILISPLNAQMAKEELQKRYAEDGLTMYELLWKYQEETIGPEEAQEILTCLKHNRLYVRVVAYCLLKSRGVQLGAYRPTDLKKSEKSLKTMEEKFKNGIE